MKSEHSRQLQLLLWRELGRRLKWGAAAYPMFAILFAARFQPRSVAAWLLSAVLLATSSWRTVAALAVCRTATDEDLSEKAPQLVWAAMAQAIVFSVYIAFSMANQSADLVAASMLVIGVAGLSSMGATMFVPVPKLAWVNSMGQCIPLYVWAALRFDLAGWLLAALLAFHGAVVINVILMSSRHVLEGYGAQLKLQAQREELRQARDAAEQASVARLRFLANMSHEIRTPLNGVIGLADALSSTPLNAEQAELLNDLSRSGGHLLAIVNDILDMAKVSSGKVRIASEVFDVHQAIRDVAVPAAVLAESRGLDFYVETDPAVPRAARGDSVRLRQVISNFLSNALKFTEEGEVQLQADVPRKGWVRFSVTDTGMGIAAADMKTLFREFHQVDSSSTRKFGGTGLGLAISQKLVELMGGRLHVDSAPGQGSCFSFEIPMAAVEAAPEKAAGPPEAGFLRGVRVLIAEDNAINRRVIARMADSAGMVVGLAENGLVAVEEFRKGCYDLILMDCQMPELDGYAATREIRRSEGPGEHIPILGVTANAFAEDRDRCLECGMDAHLAKPVTRESLYGSIGKVMGQALRPVPPG